MNKIMNDQSDTPETDAEFDVAHNFAMYYDCQAKHDNIPYPLVVPADFARRLERERNEARIETEKARSYKRVLKTENSKLRQELSEAREAEASEARWAAQYKAERDEARKLYETERKDLAFMLKVMRKTINELDQLRNQLREEQRLHVETLNERDEARKLHVYAYEQLKAKSNELMNAQETVERLVAMLPENQA